VWLALRVHREHQSLRTQSYVRQASGYNHVLSGLIVTLPAGVTSPYFIDTVGNVSTSHFRPASTAARSPRARPATSSLELKPRYPLFGGWQYDFTIGYDAPLRSHLRRLADGSYLLAVPFLTASRDMAVDDAEVRIVLPEGATCVSCRPRARANEADVRAHSDVKVHPPFPASPRLVMHKTYLDTTGRPAVVLSKRICTDKHAIDVLVRPRARLRDARRQIDELAQVSYRYRSTALLQKPMAVAGVAFAMFLAGIGLRRVRWQIEGAAAVSQKRQ
jgi:oligosaccharyltransferase complex subunit alpha (ribophorin I)